MSGTGARRCSSTYLELAERYKRRRTPGAFGPVVALPPGMIRRLCPGKAHALVSRSRTAAGSISGWGKTHSRQGAALRNRTSTLQSKKVRGISTACAPQTCWPNAFLDALSERCAPAAMRRTGGIQAAGSLAGSRRSRQPAHPAGRLTGRPTPGTRRLIACRTLR